MQVILETLQKAFSDNLQVMALLLLSDLGTTVINIVLGTIAGTREDSFDLKKFLFGFVKLFASQVTIFGFCYFLNLIGLTLDLIEEMIGIKVITDQGQSLIITIFDLCGVIVARIKDTCLDVLEKIKKMRTLKYIKYEDIQINTETEKGIG